jgi:hypothetical protein
MTGVATAIGAAAVIGAGATAYSASKAAGSAKNAQNIAQNENQYIQQQEQPYVQSGDQAESQLNYLLGNGPKTGVTSSAGGYGSLNAPFTIQDFHNLSPAYQFQLQQGRQGVLNGAASGQGALSGAALTGLTDYNQSEANTAFNNAFNQYQTQQQNVYQRLAGVATIGQNAAGQQATSGANLAGTAAQASVAQGNIAANEGTSIAGIVGNAGTTGALYSAYGGGGTGDPNYYNAAAGGPGALYGGAGNVIGQQ